MARPVYHYWAVALSGLALAISVVFIVQHMQLPMGAAPGDEHAEFGHWAMTAAFALSVPLLGMLGSLGNAGRRIPAVGAAVLATLYGVGSILHPAQAPSLGMTGGAIVERLITRKNNPYGTTPRSLARVLEQLETVEPLLRKAATHEINTSAPIDPIVKLILEVVQSG